MTSIPIFNLLGIIYIFAEGKIYTWIGANRQVLLAINPYEDLGLYTKEKMNYYSSTANSVRTPEPHVFGIAAACLDSLLFENRDQSILVSGESGSGKTQATKQCLDYLTHVAGSRSDEKPPEQKRGGGGGGIGRRRRRQMPGEGPTVVADIKNDDSIEEKIMVANPLLEAFGNAKTTRNNNSSRFGKWIAVYFKANKKKVTGAKIENFLLETTRVIHQAENERNYHIFYELFTDDDMREKYSLSRPEDYRILNAGNCTTVKTIDDAKDFAEVRRAMEKLKIEDDEAEWAFRTAAALIHLGNVEFETQKEGKVKKTVITNPDELALAGELLGLATEDLSLVLRERTIKVRGEVTVVPRKLGEAEGARDSLAKAAYGNLFDYLVDRVNESFEEASGKLIGILDIFGFELFETNSFEQLCINFTNEKLQEMFNKDTFEEEQETYDMEKIKYEKIHFSDNKTVIEMIDKVPDGIFNLLDDECIAPKGSEEKFLGRVVQAHEKKGVKLFKASEKNGTFTITHFAGKVTYTVEGFLLKNRDKLNQDLYDICAKSSDPLTQFLFPKMDESQRLKLKSTSGKFRDQLRSLLKLLTRTTSHYIRCVKPNKEQTPKNFNGRKSIKQFQSAGILDSVKLRQKGFPQRMYHQDFIRVYKNVNGPNVVYRSHPRDAKALCKEIIEKCFKKRKLTGIQVGTVQVLFRREEFRFLELSRTLAFAEFLPLVQARARGFLARRFYWKLKEASDALQTAVKEGDMEAIERIEEELPKKLGRLGELYGIRPKKFESARREVEKMRKWDPIKERLERYADYTEESGVEELTEEELELLMKDILVLSETVRIPKEVKEGYEHIKDLHQRVHRAQLAGEEFLDLLKPKSQVDPELITTAVEYAEKEEKKETKVIEEDAERAIFDADKAALREVVLRAEEIGYTSANIEKAKEMLSMSDYQFTKLQYEVLQGRGEEKTIREKMIRLRELELAENFDKYKYIYKYPGFRDIPEWSVPVCCIPARLKDEESDKRSAHRRANRVRKMLVWDPFLLEASLLKLPKENNREATDIFSAVWVFMEEDDTDEEGLLVVNTGVAFPELRDEIFAQIIKQLTDNPDGTSVARGVELLGLCLAAFVPNDPEFGKYLYVWLRTHLPYGIYRHYMSAAHESEFGGLSGEFISLQKVQERLDSTSSGSRHSQGWTKDPWNIPKHHIRDVFKDYGLDETDGFFADFENEEEKEKREQDSRIAQAKKKIGATLNRLSYKGVLKKAKKKDDSRMVEVVMESTAESIET